MTSPAVSILLPVRDAAATLAGALQSLLAQTWPDFECLVIDDGSIDGSAEIARRTVGSDARFRLLAAEHRGIAGALQVAASLARAPLLARQDADDVSDPERIERQVEFLHAHPEFDVVATQVRHTGAPLTAGGRRYAQWLRSCRTPEAIAHGLWTESPLPHPTVVMRREIYERVGGYRDVGWPEDYDLWLRMLRAGARFAKIDAELYSWTDRPDRASRALDQYGADRFLACRAHHLAAHLAGRPVSIWGAGRDGRRFARAFLEEGGTVDRFLDIDPRKIGRRAYGRPILDVQIWLAGAPHLEPVGEGDAPVAPARAATGQQVVVAAVGAAGARALIRRRLVATGFIEGESFFCVA